jgi:hypothetical protein
VHDTDVVAECMRVLLEAAAGLLVPSLSAMQAVNLVCACTFLYLSHSGGDLWSSEDGLKGRKWRRAAPGYRCVVDGKQLVIACERHFDATSAVVWLAHAPHTTHHSVCT